MKLIKKHWLEILIIVFILLLAAFLRFYKLSEYMTFLGDEGRDVLIIKKLLQEGDIPFIGPPSSVGNISLGPLYYYMMAVPMGIFKLNPVAAAGQVALIGVVTVGLVYYLGRIWFGKVAGAISALLYTISPVTIIYSRSSWNPNPAPFFALLGMFGIYKAHKSGDFRWLVLVGGASAAALQMHYLATVLIPIFGILWLYELILRPSRKADKYFLSGTLGGVVTFFLIMLPLILFDLNHHFLNFRAIKQLLTNSQTVDFNILSSIFGIVPIYVNNLVGRYIAGQNQTLAWVVAFLIVLPIFVFIIRKFRGDKVEWIYLALGTWLIIGLLGLTFYKSSIFDHYLGFMNPVPFLLLGSLSVFAKGNKKFIVYTVLIALVGLLVFINLSNNPLKYPPNRQVQRTQEIARFIIKEANEQPFNFALIAKNNYDAAYQFYLSYFGYSPKNVHFEQTEQLFVVCEDSVCEPINNSKTEIAAFGWAKVENESQIQGIKIYKLVHNPSGRSW